MRYSDDPIADFNDWDREQQRQLNRRPRCRCCGEHIQDDYAFLICGKWICEDCIYDFHKEIPDD